MAAAETMKTTVEQFTTASNQAFKDGVEKSLAALAEANTHSKKNLEAVVASVTTAAPRSVTDVLIHAWSAAGLRKPSAVRLSRLDCLEQSLLIARLGAVDTSLTSQRRAVCLTATM